MHFHAPVKDTEIYIIANVAQLNFVETEQPGSEGMQNVTKLTQTKCKRTIGFTLVLDIAGYYNHVSLFLNPIKNYNTAN